MKKVLVCALALMAALSTFAQGTVNFANTIGTKVMIDKKDGSAASAVPTSGAYTVGLWWAPVGTTAESAFTRVGGNATFTPLPGMFNGGTVTIAGIGAGAGVALQVRGWEVAAGSYDIASTTAGKFSGKSAIFTLLATGNPNPPSPTTPVSITSAGMFTGMTMTPTVPEPSTIAFGILGIAGLLALRRRS